MLADAPQAQPGIGTFPFDLTGPQSAGPRVRLGEDAGAARPASVTVRDFEFELPQAPIEATATIPERCRPDRSRTG